MLGRILVGSGFHARPSVALTDLGVEVQKTIKHICDNNEGIEIPQYVIMPNHVHMIIALDNAAGHDGKDAAGYAGGNAVGHGNPTLQDVVGRIKSYTAKRWCDMGGMKHQTFWQRSFHDRIIRDEAEYRRIWQYIDENPARWTEDEYYGL